MTTTPDASNLDAILKRNGITAPSATLRAGAFGDSEALSNYLVSLILNGEKRATCSLLWSWEFEGEAITTEGDMEVVHNFEGQPVLIRRVTRVDITPFGAVQPEFAAAEGEGDRSLQYWRTEHWRFFEAECARIGRVPAESMPLVCEWFEVVATLDKR